MPTLGDMVEIIRSKNAGPFFLTIDLLFDDKTKYLKVKNSDILKAGTISKLYKVNKKDVKIYYYDKAKGIKITIPRRFSSGCMYDTDVFGAQQHTLIMALKI